MAACRGTGSGAVRPIGAEGQRSRARLHRRPAEVRGGWPCDFFKLRRELKALAASLYRPARWTRLGKGLRLAFIREEGVWRVLKIESFTRFGWSLLAAETSIKIYSETGLSIKA